MDIDLRNYKSSFSIQCSQDFLSPDRLGYLYDRAMDIQETIAAWIRSARKQAKLSGEELGAKLAIELRTARGHTKGNISHWELGKHQPSLAQLMAISKITGVPLPDEVLGATNYDELVGRALAASGLPSSTTSDSIAKSTKRVPIQTIEEDVESSDAVRIRRVKLKLSAGIVGFQIDQNVEDDNENPVFFKRRWLEAQGLRHESLIALRVNGQSMEPGLYEGDTVTINTADTKPVDGAVYAVNYEGEDVIKRLVRDMGFWWLVSDNPDQRRYPRKQCANEMCILIGKVIHKQSIHI